LKIQNISKINSGNSYGHSFDLVADLQYKANTGTAHQDATLKWEEKTSRPPSWQTNITAGTWNDMFALYPTSPTFNGWTQNRTKPCPGKETATITDPPAADVNLPARTLEYRITVSSAAGAGCTTASKTVTAKQVLVPDAVAESRRRHLRLREGPFPQANRGDELRWLLTQFPKNCLRTWFVSC
jgi:hypothetical protein